MSSLNRNTSQISDLGQLLRAVLDKHQQKENTMNFNKLFASNVRTARGNFIVGNVSAAGFSVSSTPVLHATATTAAAECARLAKLEPGKTFIYLQVCGGATVAELSKF